MIASAISFGPLDRVEASVLRPKREKFAAEYTMVHRTIEELGLPNVMCSVGA